MDASAPGRSAHEAQDALDALEALAGGPRTAIVPHRRGKDEMAGVNPHYGKLKAGYLFPEIGPRVRAFQVAHPDARIIRLGIGDVVLPLPPTVVSAMHQAVDEMGTDAGFHGYGPEQGYDFLREAIAEHDFRARGCDIDASEIFVSDGSK